MNLAEHPYVLSLLLGIVEGLTEFLPVSSTAHLRLLKPLVGVSLDDPYWKMYDVVIQLGAILAVALYFRVRIGDFLRTFPRGKFGDRTALTHPLSLVMLAFVVTAVPAFLLSKLISDNLESLLVIGCSLLVGGVVMWVVDVYFGKDEGGGGPMPEETGATSTAGVVGDAEAEQQQHPHELEDAVQKGETATMDRMRPWQAAWIGAVQILSAVFPGTSRSMSTIAAGQTAGLTRSAALEFSFFLSIPIMCAACSYDLLKTVRAKPGDAAYLGAGGLTGEQWGVLLVGFFVSFVVAWFVIAWFMAWVRRRGFVPFAVYRILVGTAVLVALLVGWL